MSKAIKTAKTSSRKTVKVLTPGQKAAATKRRLGLDLNAIARKAVRTRRANQRSATARKAVRTRHAHKRVA